MKNILFITSSINFGGAAKMLCFVAESLRCRGYNICIVNLKSTQNTTDYERKLHDDIKLVTVPQFIKSKRLNHIRFIKKTAKDFKAEILVGFTNFPNMYATLVGKMLGIPSIISERGNPQYTFGNSVKDKILVAIVNSSRGGVFQTDGAKAYYGKGLQKRGIVIPNPIFINGEIPNVKQSEREKTVVSVGRLDNFQKRYDVMLDAFKIFVSRYDDYILKLYGTGNDEKLITEWVEERNLTDNVRFMGLTTQPMQDIARDGMFLITSDFEGISNSLLEAMAVGLPCVSTDHTPGGARLLIQDHENGLLAPVGDAEGLAKAMCEFAENSELAEKCSNNARDVVNRFDPQRIIDMWEEYINKSNR